MSVFRKCRPSLTAKMGHCCLMTAVTEVFVQTWAQGDDMGTAQDARKQFGIAELGGWCESFFLKP